MFTRSRINDTVPTRPSLTGTDALTQQNATKLPSWMSPAQTPSPVRLDEKLGVVWSSRRSRAKTAGPAAG